MVQDAEKFAEEDKKRRVCRTDNYVLFFMGIAIMFACSRT